VRNPVTRSRRRVHSVPVIDFVNTPLDGDTGAATEIVRLSEVLAGSLVRAGVLAAQDAVDLLARAHPGELRSLLDEAISLRRSLRSVLQSFTSGDHPSAMQLDALSAALAKRRAELQLAMEDGRLRWVATSPDPLDQALALISTQATELLTSAEHLSRVRACDGVNCGRFFMDRTKNRSGRWCEMRSCGNRAKARRFYARRRAAVSLHADVSQADGVP
jgi:predicted RNA-binding Zn ribbon-like protein